MTGSEAFRAAAALLIAAPLRIACAQELVLEEVRVEAPFDFRLDLPNESAVQTMVERLRISAEARRELELLKANQSTATKILDLLKMPAFIPFGLGNSTSRTDDFFLQNSMRADLNPRNDNPLFSP